MTADPLTVACPDCGAPRGEACRLSEGWPDGSTHATRRDSARLHTVEHGTCLLCHHPAVKGERVEDGPIIAWHPDPRDAEKCPPLPDPRTNWNAYAEAINAGAEPGVIGVDNFRAQADDEQVTADVPCATTLQEPTDD